MDPDDFQLPFIRPKSVAALPPKKPPTRRAAMLDEAPSTPQAVAYTNELHALRALHYFGNLRPTEIAYAVWPDRPRQHAKMLALSVVARLLSAKAILAKPNSLGDYTYVLAPKGVRRLLDMDIQSTTGAHLATAGPNYYHRTVGSCYLLDRASQEEVAVYNEYAIQKEWSPLTTEISRNKYHKFPDGLVTFSGHAHGYAQHITLVDWIEVESAPKDFPRLCSCFNILTKDPFLDEEGTHILNKLIFVVDSSTLHENRITSALTRYFSQNPQIHPRLLLDRLVIARAQIERPLNWWGYSHIPGPKARTRAGKLLGDLYPAIPAPSPTDTDSDPETF